MPRDQTPTTSMSVLQPPHRAQNRRGLVAKVIGVAESAPFARGAARNKAAKVTVGVGGRESEYVTAGIRPLSISS